VETILLSVPQAAAIWMILLLVATVTAAVLTLPRLATARPALALRAVPDEPAAPAEPEPEDDLRYAREVAVAADRAAVTAQRRRDEWTAAQDEVDAAWAAYDAADRAARRVAAAAAYPVMRRRRAPGERADRERYLHHAAIALCRRREISIAQLNDILAHRGWNPRLHPAAQESALRAAVRDHRYAVYLAAAERERQAWAAAEQAAVALSSLRAEACAAPVRTDTDTIATDASWWAEQWTTADPARTAAA
jgi:hypothetical protein